MREDLRRLERQINKYNYLLIWCVSLTAINYALVLWLLQRDSKPDWNFISVVLSILQTFLAIAVIGGFWMLRSAAQESARQTAQAVAEDEARIEARRAAEEWLNARLAGQQASDDVASLVEAFGRESGEG